MLRLLCWTIAVLLMGHIPAIHACSPARPYRPLVNTPFLIAISADSVVDVERYLRDGANPNQSSANSVTTPVRTAVYARALGALHALHKAGADVRGDRRLVNIIYESSARPTEKAALISELADVGLSLNVADEANRSPLLAAVQRQPKEVIHALVKAGADPNLGEPICTAAAYGRADVFDFLLNNGAKLVATCSGGSSLSALAASSSESGSVRILQTLSEKRYAIDAQSLIHRVSLVEQARYLVSLGADPKRRLPDGSTVLHYVPSTDLIRYFAELGVDVNARDSKGNTALHKFAERALIPATSCGEQDPQIWIVSPIRELLKHGANPGLYNAARKTPLELGVGKHHSVGLQLSELLQ